MPSAEELSRLLSREDHAKWLRDLIAYGQAALVQNADGTVRYVSNQEMADENNDE
jgi:hypothetical protein